MKLDVDMTLKICRTSSITCDDVFPYTPMTDDNSSESGLRTTIMATTERMVLASVGVGDVI